MLNGKKICGILIEVKDINKAEKRFIIGAGVNVNQESFPDEISDKATSLNIETGVKISREKLLINIINSLYYNEELINNKEKLFELWNKEFNHTGKKIKIRKYVDDEEISVTIKELNTDGGLVVEHEDGKVETYYSGEISLSYSEFKKV
jgi:BirA family biotin operon repressor/biotin-[acetyl-CoA-carboxylase] ligase